jgi:hypothetical protein
MQDGSREAISESQGQLGGFWVIVHKAHGKVCKVMVVMGYGTGTIGKNRRSGRSGRHKMQKNMQQGGFDTKEFIGSLFSFLFAGRGL